jgi:hypothetical protein
MTVWTPEDVTSSWRYGVGTVAIDRLGKVSPSALGNWAEPCHPSSMARNPTCVPTRIQSLLDERDDLMVQISLEADSSSANPDSLLEMQHRLRAIEREILDTRPRMP